MGTAAGLLAALAADPGDHAVRLALADALEEAGRDAQAELARLHARQLMRVGSPEELARLCALLASGVRPVVPEVMNSVGMRFVPVPPGTFLMGSPKGEECRGDDEGPQREVEVSRAFWMGDFPVTVGQFRGFLEATGHDMGTGGAFCSNPGFPQTDDGPVTQVNWNDASAFVTWLSGLDAEREAGSSYRLPSEAEWERSCRAGADFYQVYHVGDTLSPAQANFDVIMVTTGGVPRGLRGESRKERGC